MFGSVLSNELASWLAVFVGASAAIRIVWTKVVKKLLKIHNDVMTELPTAIQKLQTGQDAFKVDLSCIKKDVEDTKEGVVTLHEDHGRVNGQLHAIMEKLGLEIPAD